jgi:hypothetical protein
LEPVSRIYGDKDTSKEGRELKESNGIAPENKEFVFE